MKCPICKKTIPDDALKCPYCNARTGLICKNCNTVNSIFDLTCKNCGKEILKLCPQCKSVNFPNAEKCRKCGHEFTTTIQEEPKPQKIKLEYGTNTVSQQSAKNLLVKGLLTQSKKILSLSGQKGVGKSLVLKAVMQSLNDRNISWLYGKCTPLTQITPGGLIQDILLNVFNLPNFCINNLDFKKNASQYFKNEFPALNNNEIFDLLNFLYPDKEGTFENIVAAKNKTFEFLNKIFDNITNLNKFVFVIDNFDFIDGFSYEFISRYIKKENIWDNLKLLLIYNEPKPSKGYFYFPENDKENFYLDVGIAPLEFKQIFMLLEQKNKKIDGFPNLNNAELQEIYKISGGNPSYINHALSLCFDCQLCGKEFEIAATFAGLLEYRLKLLEELNPIAYDILVGSAIIGDKINMNLVKEIFGVDDETFRDILIYLKKMDYINHVNDIYCEFGSLTLWETILKTSKNS